MPSRKEHHRRQAFLYLLEQKIPTKHAMYIVENMKRKDFDTWIMTKLPFPVADKVREFSV